MTFLVRFSLGRTCEFLPARTTAAVQDRVHSIPAMPDDFPYGVFLSHSAKDKAVVRDVPERLRKDGVRVWFDEWVLKPGDSI